MKVSAASSAASPEAPSSFAASISAAFAGSARPVKRSCSFAKHTPEAFKAWSQNLGHEGVLTTFRSYGEVSSARQAQIIRAVGTTAAMEVSEEDRRLLAAVKAMVRSP